MSIIKKIFRNNVAEISAPTKGTVTKTAIAVTGTVVFYKDGSCGVAYKKHSASSWTHKVSSSQNISMNITSLTAGTEYDIKLYVLFNNEYQYGETIQVETAADA